MEAYKSLWNLVDGLLDFVYPRNIECILCRDPIEKKEKYAICASCKKKIHFAEEKTCKKCGKPLEELYLPELCHDCMMTKHFFTRSYTCVVYDEEIKTLLYRLKYGKQRYLAYHMAEMMTAKIKEKELEQMHWIIPVPLHTAKKRQREFNQSEIISQYISRQTGWPMDEKNLIRIKDTATQNKLSREERKINMKNAFQILKPEKIKAKKILLVDDIYTTGSTLNSCSKELLRAGALDIYAITFAAGKNI
ncbi:ComF family protein [Geosporobacter ferrireducens]|uniref:ComF family protein n=1 Tax=Geosporobacter ferrireducens TaxID=1424294 RepID=A0A1D8GGN1_9FIRM|nr:ComF family protein [Geosporobacter ferrireducens]AOT70033.1 hypothetical protein Gferi_10800 [Geosporobacter ferrireducens]